MFNSLAEGSVTQCFCGWLCWEWNTQGPGEESSSQCLNVMMLTRCLSVILLAFLGNLGLQWVVGSGGVGEMEGLGAGLRGLGMQLCFGFASDVFEKHFASITYFYIILNLLRGYLCNIIIWNRDLIAFRLDLIVLAQWFLDFSVRGHLFFLQKPSGAEPQRPFEQCLNCEKNWRNGG